MSHYGLIVAVLEIYCDSLQIILFAVIYISTVYTSAVDAATQRKLWISFLRSPDANCYRHNQVKFQSVLNL